MLQRCYYSVEIEKAIKQSRPFTNEYQKTGVNLIFTSNLITGELQKFFKTFGLTTKQYNILRILKGAGKPVSTLYIKQRLLDRNSDASRVVDRMEAKGFVKKTICETDKRLVDVELTVNGKVQLNIIEREINVMSSIFKNLTESEVKTLNHLLNKIRENNFK